MCGSIEVPSTVRLNTVFCPLKLEDMSSIFKDGPASYPCVAGNLPMYAIK